MRDLLTHGAAAFGLSGFVVVDCRYDYEHKGGHLPGVWRWPGGTGWDPVCVRCELWGNVVFTLQHGCYGPLTAVMAAMAR